jgi:hypothetical protein
MEGSQLSCFAITSQNSIYQADLENALAFYIERCYDLGKH